MTAAITARPDLIACVLQLDALGHSELERTQGHRLHGLFMELLQHVDPDLASALHGPAVIKPFTVATLNECVRRLRPGSGYSLRIALLRGDLFPPFSRAFLQHPQRVLRLGQANFAVRAVLITPDSHPWAGLTTWDALYETASAAETCTLHFVTPTVFTAGEDPAGHKQFNIFPEPSNVFGALLRRWNMLATQPLPADLLQRVEITARRYRLETEMLRFKNGPQLGFVGECTYRLLGAATDVRMVQALGQAAFFLGVGYKTTQGMGLLRAEIGG